MAKSNQAVQVPSEVATAEIETTAPAVKTNTIKDSKEDLIKTYGNKSNAIRALSAAGHSRSEIATALDIRYQHVRNVLLQPLKRQIAAERANGNNSQE